MKDMTFIATVSLAIYALVNKCILIFFLQPPALFKIV